MISKISAMIIGIVLGALVIVPLATAQAADPDDPPEQAAAPDDPFAQASRQLLQGLKTKFNLLKQAKGAGKNARQFTNPKAMILPLDLKSAPVPATLIDEWNENLTREMTSAAGDHSINLSFIDRVAVPGLVRVKSETDLDRSETDILKDTLAQVKADIFIRSVVSTVQGGYQVSYRVLDRDSATLAMTRRIPIPLSADTLNDRTAGLALSVALEAAVKKLAGMGSKVRRILLGNVIDGNSGSHSRFGDYVLQKSADDLQATLSNNITGHYVAIAPAEISGTTVRQYRNSALPYGSIDSLRTSGSAGDFILAGRYWDFGRSVELTLTLHNHDGLRHRWRDRINKDTIPVTLQLSTASNGDNSDDAGTDGVGAMGLELNSPRGKNPVYKVNEKIILLVKTERDGHLHCYYRQSDGKVIKVFPNPFHKSSRIHGGVLTQLAGPGMRFTFEFTPPTGRESFRCFASETDPTPRLPKELKAISLERLPPNIAGRLTRIYHGLPGIRFAESSLVVTVLPKDRSTRHDDQ